MRGLDSGPASATLWYPGNVCLDYRIPIMIRNSHLVKLQKATATRTATTQRQATEPVTNYAFKLLILLVPGGGVEPPRAEARRILSPLRLPVPPSRLCTRQVQLIKLLTSCCSIAAAALKGPGGIGSTGAQSTISIAQSLHRRNPMPGVRCGQQQVVRVAPQACRSSRGD